MTFMPMSMCWRTASIAANGAFEYSDDDGGCYVTLFAGPEAERRARDYFSALRTGRVKIIREGATEH
jgi:hypothetical protein